MKGWRETEKEGRTEVFGELGRRDRRIDVHQKQT